MLSKMTRPCRTATTIVAKLSSPRIIRDASLVTSVPVTPMATPMSADFSAGASLTPSPVIATFCPSDWSASTSLSLCRGDTRTYLGDRRGRLGPWRVDDADHPYVDEVALHRRVDVARRIGR